MTSRPNSTRTRSVSILELARRSAVRLVAGGAAALSIASIVQVLLGDVGGALTLAAAVPTGAVAVIMLRQDRPNVVGLLALVAAFAIATEIYAAIDGQTQYVTSIGSELVVFALGILSVFIARDRPRLVAIGYLAGSALIIVVAQLHLNGPSLEIATDIVVMAATLGTLMYIVIRVIESLSASEARFSDLANVIPVATIELDVSRVMDRITALQSPDMVAETVYGGRDISYAELVSLVRMSFSNHYSNSLAESFGKWNEFAVGPNAEVFRREAIGVLMSAWQGVNSGAGELSVQCFDGSIQHFIYRWSLGKADGRSVPGSLVVAATDVTDLRHVEQELEQQLLERDQFVASVSHELRTPLTSIMGLTDELVQRPDAFDPHEQAELLGIVAAETRDVVNIVDDLLVTARAESGQLQINLVRCDLAAEAMRLSDLLGGKAEAGDELWTVADPVRLRQVVRNLLSNAKRYGGPDVRMKVRQEGDKALVEIRDNGGPLPSEARERIFGAYERAGEQGAVGSVGLGLHVARLLARLMNGDLTYEHDGADSIFALSLPLSAAVDAGSDK